LLVTGIGFTFLKFDGVAVATFKELSIFIEGIFAIYVGGNVGDKVAVLADRFLKNGKLEVKADDEA